MRKKKQDKHDVCLKYLLTTIATKRYSDFVGNINCKSLQRCIHDFSVDKIRKTMH
jgi:hypothetical protein